MNLCETSLKIENLLKTNKENKSINKFYNFENLVKIIKI